MESRGHSGGLRERKGEESVPRAPRVPPRGSLPLPLHPSPAGGVAGADQGALLPPATADPYGVTEMSFVNVSRLSHCSVFKLWS